MNLVKKYVIAAIIGVIVGIVTVIGQKYLSIEFNFLANSGAIWLIPAFLISYFSKLAKKHSVIISIICLLCCLLGYYVFEALLNRHSLNGGFYLVVWTACAFIGGGTFGFGAYLAYNSTGVLKYCGQNLLPAVFLAEGINKMIHINEYMHMACAVVIVTLIGVLLYFIINGKAVLAKGNLLSLLFITMVGLIGYEILFKITL